MRNAVLSVMVEITANGPTLDELIAEKKAGPAPYVLSEWEQAFVRTEADLYPAPQPQFLEAHDGLRLAYRESIPDEWSGLGEIYLIVPGSTSHSLHFRFLGFALRDRGILTRVIDFRGTGFSVGKSAEDCGSPVPSTPRASPSTMATTSLGVSKTLLTRTRSLAILKLTYVTCASVGPAQECICQATVQEGD